MSVSHSELKTVFDLSDCRASSSKCPKSLRSVLEEAATNPNCNTLDLSDPRVTLSYEGWPLKTICVLMYPFIIKEDVPYILAFLMAYPHIKILDLSHNALGGAETLNLLGENTTLHTLILAKTYFDYHALSMADTFRHNKTLKHLDFSHNSLDENINPINAQDTERLHKTKVEYDNMQRLSNYFSTMWLPYFIKKDWAVLFADMALESLKLRNTRIQTLGSLPKNRTLKAVDISDNIIPELDIIELASNPAITSLNLARCKLDIDFLITLASINSSLTHLDFSAQSEIHWRGDAERQRRRETAFIALAEMPCLQSLTMNHAYVTNEDLRALAKSQSIRLLSLEFNQILDLSCLKDTKITHLNLKYNNLTYKEPYNAAKILADMGSLIYLNVKIDISNIGYEDAKLLLDKNGKRIKPAFTPTEWTILQGTYPKKGAKSPLLILRRADRVNALRRIFEFLQPSFELIHDFPSDIMDRYANEKKLEAEKEHQQVPVVLHQHQYNPSGICSSPPVQVVQPDPKGSTHSSTKSKRRRKGH